MNRRTESDFETHDDFDYIENLDRGDLNARKKAIANKRRIDEILETRQLKEDIGDIEYLLSHRNRNKIHRKDRKRRE
jgi:hypothetical protein